MGCSKNLIVQEGERVDEGNICKLQAPIFISHNKSCEIDDLPEHNLLK